jgi:putative two-component system response regulator
MDIAVTRMKRAKQGLVLFLALFSTCLVASVMIYTYAQGNLLGRVQDELATLAKIASLHVDMAKHEKLATADQEGSPLQLEQNTRLRRVIQETKDVRYIYTVRRVPGGFAYVLDAAEPVDADADGTTDKSSLLEPFTADTKGLERAFKTATPAVDTEASQDQYGRFWSAYVPILGEDGRVAAVLGVDVNASLVEKRQSELFDIFCWSTLLSLIICAIVSAIYGFRFLELEPDTRSSRFRTFLRQAFEIGLAVVTVVAVAMGSISQSNLASNRSMRLVESRHLEVLNLALSSLSQSQVGGSPGQVADIASRLSRSRTPWLGGAYLEALTDKKVDEPLSNLIQRIDSESRSSAATIQTLLLEEEGHAMRLNMAIVTAIMVVACTFLLLRHRSRREGQMIAAVRKGRKAESDLGQIVEHVPVGLFTYSEEEVVYANPAWKEMSGGGDVNAAEFLNRLSPSDRTALQGILRSEDTESLVRDLTFRVILGAGRSRHVSMKALQLPGDETHAPQVLAFALDITESVEARNSLQAKSQEVELKNRMLAAALEDLESNLESVVRCLVRAVEAKDPYTAGHSERVMEYSLWIGEELGLGPYEMRVLELGTLVHDVGKIGIADAILTKPGKLTDLEYAEIKTHPELGVRILEGIGLFHDCMPIVRWHHERLDGSGYPDKLKGDEIPFLVRISAVADVFDAMTSTRAYRSGIEPRIVLRFLKEDAEKGFLDPIVVAALETAVARRGVIPQADSNPLLRKAS